MDVRLSGSLRFNLTCKSPETFVKMQILLKGRVRWGGVQPKIVLFSKSKCIRKLTVMLRNFSENKLVLPFISLIFFLAQCNCNTSHAETVADSSTVTEKKRKGI